MNKPEIPISAVDTITANPKLERIQKLKIMLHNMKKKEGKPYLKLKAEYDALTTNRAKELHKEAKSRNLTPEELEEIKENYIGITWKKE
jgi:hypothetical protein